MSSTQKIKSVGTESKLLAHENQIKRGLQRLLENELTPTYSRISEDETFRRKYETFTKFTTRGLQPSYRDSVS